MLPAAGNVTALYKTYCIVTSLYFHIQAYVMITGLDQSKNTKYEDIRRS